MGMIGLPKPLFNINKIDEIILKNMFKDMLKETIQKSESQQQDVANVHFMELHVFQALSMLDVIADGR